MSKPNGITDWLLRFIDADEDKIIAPLKNVIYTIPIWKYEKINDQTKCNNGLTFGVLWCWVMLMCKEKIITPLTIFIQTVTIRKYKWINEQTKCNDWQLGFYDAE